jgi:hypothetical protein
MNWVSPSFEEINMSAEIGGYQGETEQGNEAPQTPAAPSQDK